MMEDSGTDKIHNNKRIAQNTLILYVRMLITIGVGLFTSRVVLNTLGIEDFGIYNVVGGIIAMFGFINQAMAASTSRYLTFALGSSDYSLLKKVFNLSLSIHALLSVLIVLLGESIGLWFFYEKMQIPAARLEAAFWVYQLSILSSVLTIMSVPYNASIISHEKMGAFAYITLSDVVLKLLIVYLLVMVPFDKLVVYGILFLLAQVINQSIYMIYCRKKFEETKLCFVWDKQLFREISSFAGWSLFGNMAYVAYTQGLNLLLNIFFGPAVNAARGIAVQAQGTITRFISSFQTAINPQITKTYAAGELNAMHKLIFASSKYSFFLLLLLSLPVLIETRPLLIWWLRIVPDYTVTFFRIMLLTSLIESLANPLIIAAGATGRIRLYQQLVGGILLLILPVSYVALKMGASPASVFVVQFICNIVAQSIRVILLRSMISFPIRVYCRKVMVRVFVVFLLSLGVSVMIYQLLPSETFVEVVAVCVSVAISTLFIAYAAGTDKSEKLVIRQKIVAKFAKIR